MQLKKYIISTLCVASLINSGFSYGNSQLKTGLQHTQKNKYSSAITALIDARKNGGDKTAMIDLSIGIAALRNTALHNSLNQMSTEVQNSYMASLNKKYRKKSLKYLPLYQAELLLHKNEAKKAIRHLNSFLKRKSISVSEKEVAYANLALAYELLNNSSKSKAYWAKVKSDHPDSVSELCATQVQAGKKPSIAAAQLDRVYSKARASSEGLSSRAISNGIVCYQAKGLLEKAFELSNETNIDRAAARENLDKNNFLSYYDPALLANLSKLYRNLSEKHLIEASKNPKFKDTALFYLMDLHIMHGDLASLRKNKEFSKVSLSQLPGRLKPIDAIKHKSTQVINGKKKVISTAAFQGVLSNKNPDTYAELLNICVATDSDCNSIVEEAIKISADTRSPQFRNLYQAAGNYLLANGKTDKAVYYLELARDKSNKNKIFANSPLLLVSLAEAYRKTLLYSENLEIFFEMSKDYPAVRQIQDAVQGIYSMEQKSSGDVKIF